LLGATSSPTEPSSAASLRIAPPMTRIFSLLGSALFIFYCTAVGVYLLLHPWFPGPRFAPGLPASGFFRGFVSGLGLVHLFAAVADLRLLARSVDPPVAGGATAPAENP
jgi:hypothetical protein